MSVELGNIHPVLGATLVRLDTAAVRWCLLRGGAELTSLDGDVDLLVHPRDLRILRALLAQGGFVEPRAWGRWPHRFFVAQLPGQPGRIKLDVVTELAFGRHAELRTHAAEGVLAGRVREGALLRPAHPDAFWALLLHALLDRGEVRPPQAIELEALAVLARSGRSPLRPTIEAACPGGWSAARIADAAAASRFDELLELAPKLRARWPGSPVVATAARAWFRSGLRRASRRLPPLPRESAQQSGAIASNSAVRSTGYG